jgi:DNA modification methylase
MGSGTTAIACLNLNRKYIGFELDKSYYDLSIKRIEDYNKQLKLF